MQLRMPPQCVPDFSSGREALSALQIAANWMIEGLAKVPTSKLWGNQTRHVLFEINLFPSPKMIKFESTRLSRVSQSLTL
jgi:hypothetical protein